jgi:hypothetical protein
MVRSPDPILARRQSGASRIVKEDGTYELREPDEAYARNFTGKNYKLGTRHDLVAEAPPRLTDSFNAG